MVNYEEILDSLLENWRLIDPEGLNEIIIVASDALSRVIQSSCDLILEDEDEIILQKNGVEVKRIVNFGYKIGKYTAFEAMILIINAHPKLQEKFEIYEDSKYVKVV